MVRVSLRHEAVPPRDDGDLGRHGRRSARPRTRTRAARRSRRTPTRPARSGIAISEAVEDAATRDDTKYALGSVLNHVLLHQTVIGQEAQKQLDQAGAYPDVVVGCTGGGSNFAGIAFPFVADKAAGKALRIVAAEPAELPVADARPLRLRLRRHRADDAAAAHAHARPHVHAGPIHAGGLRYHGMAPLVSQLVHEGSSRPSPTARTSASRRACGSRAPRASSRRPSRRTRSARSMVEVEAARAAGESRTILFNLCGHGHLELGAYQQYLNGELVDIELAQAESTRPPRCSWGCPPRGRDVRARRDRAGDECGEVGLELLRARAGGCTSCGRPRSSAIVHVAAQASGRGRGGRRCTRWRSTASRGRSSRWRRTP